MTPPLPPEPPEPPTGEGGPVDDGQGPTRFDPFRDPHKPVDPNGQTEKQSDLPPYAGQERPVRGPFRQGERVGKYRILTRIASGGFAVVYHAKQEEGVARDVAIKVIRTDKADNPDIVARFKQEQQLLATLSHPNIVKVLEVGESPTGEPYCVMEYIQGKPITMYCDDHLLPLRQRLELMVQVCEAVYYANRHGVIHRDLSPSNILVAVHQGADPHRGVGVTPIVIDFNAAKWPAGAARPFSPVTEIGQLIGKLAYMSPEQMSPGGGELDERSDVYSLGVVMYELLVGDPPFAPEVLESRAVDAVRAIVRTRVPDKPSTALSAMGPRASSVAMKRGAKLEALAKELESGFGEVPLMALEKLPEHRYRNAREMADDLRRALRGESTIAGRFVLGIFVGKTLARYRPYLWAAGVIVVALVVSVAGLSVATYVAMKARDEKEVSRLAAVESEKRADKERDEARRQEYLANIAAADLAIQSDRPDDARRFLEACDPQLRGWEWTYLNRTRDRSQLLWNPDAGGRIASLTVDPRSGMIRAAETVRWISIDAGTPGASATGGSRIRGPDGLPESHVRSVDPNGTYALLLDRAGTERWLLIDAATEKVVRELGPASSPDDQASGTSARRAFAVFSPDGGWLALTLRSDAQSAAKIHLFRLRDLDGGISVPLADAGVAAFSGDGKYVVVGDRSLTVFETATGTMVRTLACDADAGAAKCLALDHDGRTCAVGTQQGTDLWTSGRTSPTRLSIAAAGAESLAISPDGRRLAAAVGQRILFFRTTDGTRIGELNGHTKRVSALAFSRDGRELYSGTSDKGEVRGWTLDEILPLSPTSSIDRIEASENSTLVVLISRDAGDAPNVHLVRTPDGNFMQTFRAAGGGAAMSHAGDRLATATDLGPVRVRSLGDPESAALSWNLPPVEGAVHMQADEYELPLLRWLPDDSAIVVLRSHTSIYRADVISATDGRATAPRAWPWNPEARGGEGFIALDLNPANGNLAMIRGTTLEILGPDFQTLLARVDLPTNAHALAWDRSGTRLAVGCISGDVLAIEAAGNDTWETRLIGTHAGRRAVNAALWLESRLLTGGGDGYVNVWDAATGRIMLTISLGNRIVSLVSQGAGRVLAATSDGRIVTLYADAAAQP